MRHRLDLRDRPASALAALAAASALLVGIVAFAPAARADEIRYLNPATCETVVEKIADVTEESWTTIGYRVKAGAPIKRIETRYLVELTRDANDSQSNAFRSAAQELRSGNFGGARAGFGQVAGGGRTTDPDSGKITFKPFPAAEGGKAKWYVDAAQYHYALASYREGLAKNDLTLVSEALRALDNDAAGEKGFLARYKEGRSRWYADAWALKGDCQLALKNFDDAAATYDALYQKLLTTPAIGARYASRAKLGVGRIAEAKGSMSEAATAYDAAAAALQSLLEQAQDACSRADLGRFFNEARMQKARIMLDAATKNDAPTDFAELRKYLETGTPDGLRQRFAGKPKEVVDAVIAGALSPAVQAVAQNGIGLAFLREKRYSEAVYAFVNVRIKYFGEADEVPRALYYLGEAAEAAAKGSTRPEAKSLYQAQADAARAELARAWPDSPWAKKKPSTPAPK